MHLLQNLLSSLCSIWWRLGVGGEGGKTEQLDRDENWYTYVQVGMYSKGSIKRFPAKKGQ